MTFTLTQLPYAKNALEPYISEQTISFHYDKHHATYLNNLNKLLANHESFQNMTLEQLIKESQGTVVGVFNNAAQVWNHTFYWQCMKKNGGGKPSDELMNKIINDFGSFDNFCSEFKNAGLTQFGSGWAWLIYENGQIKITKTGNADTPLMHNQTALLTCDVWEHAYYLDYQNKRPNYIDTFLNHLINWDFVSDNYKKALSND